MALPPQFLDELRARTPIAAVIGRRVKLSRSGRNWKGCCPFHGEKTPSFYVYEDGYHCFGCGAHGDAISFVMQSQGAEFLDAVAQLAGEAGLEVPKPTESDTAAQQRWDDLHQVLAAVEAEYRRRLALPEGRAARDYLERRGLSAATIERFGLGWSGEGRGGLATAMAREGIPTALLAEAGLLRDGEAHAELFYNRVMFPIRDRRGRTISFGGRILGDGQPKYVNGPETPLFSKRRSLYALDLAREAARKPGVENRVVVVEGYMDVIALHQAGFGAAVAPLGTALTAEQLEELWRLSPEPVLCFDGDAAGGRAAMRAAELALPLVSTARGLKIATLPAADDPDSLVRRDGQAGFARVLDVAKPLSVALFDMLAAQPMAETAEGRAAFSRKLEDTAALISDRTLSWEFRQDWRGRFKAATQARRPAFQKFGGQNASFGRGEFRGGRPAPRPVALPPRPVPGALPALERPRILAAILLRHPDLLHDVEEAWASLALPDWQQALRAAVLDCLHHMEVLDSAALIAHLNSSGCGAQVAQALAATPLPLPDCARAEAMAAEAEAGWWQFFGLINRPGLEEEIASTTRQLEESWDAAVQKRLVVLREAHDRAVQEAE